MEPDPTVNGYNLYYGPAPANYTNVISAGLTNQVVVNGLVAGSTNFFVVTALNIYGIESLFSDPPVMYVVPFSNSVVSLNGLTRTYDGGPKPVSVTTIPAGLSVVVTYNGLSTLPVNAGQYQVVATVVDPVYTGSASNTLTITKAPLTILFGNLDWNYDGTP
ncbi:MAG TPA: MBG domain-containing protein, partial [Verrucomicrobiae bacterium]|nr:MBG domain-containing protein [Verrucomicrobiae bacterium]